MIGTTVSHYNILEKLGEGGMGVVYKAQDTKLNRAVALKFLPTHLSASEQDKARFLQEAQAAASLSHPNICTIYGIDEHEGPASADALSGKQIFIAMELVEGQTLRDNKQSFSIKQTVDIGVQIADGLAAAHEKGIVHRDIKPENIMVRKDGIVQIMDFGLAKLRGASRLTKEGTMVGTVGYMSPEQVQGQETDHRTDIFSLGVILYEMLSGQSPFRGVHETAIIYEIVNVDTAPLSSLKPEIDPELDAIVLECLAKEKTERYQSVAEVAKELRRFKRESSRTRVSRVSITREAYRPSGIQTSGGVIREEGHAQSSKRSAVRNLLTGERLAWGGIVAVLFALAIVHVLEGTPEIRTFRSTILPPDKSVFATTFGGHIALSPDGRLLAFVAKDSAGRSLLWVRPLNAIIGQPLNGTDDATFPFWSSDSRTIGFFAGGKLKKIEASGGPSQVICDAEGGRGGSWSHDGTIVFCPSGGRFAIYRVSSAGGEPAAVTTLDSSLSEQSHRWPFFLPDGRHFLYVTRTTSGATTDMDGIYVASLDTTVKPHLLFHGSSSAAYAGGHLLFARSQTLMAQPFDAASLTTTGEAFPIAEGVYFESFTSRTSFSASTNGVLAYQTGAGSAGVLLPWFDRRGKQVGAIGQTLLCYDLRLSPDGKKVAVSQYDSKNRNLDIWLYEIGRTVWTRFTFDQATDRWPIWSPDGNTIVFSSARKGPANLYRRPSSGAGGDEALLESNRDKIASDWSRDGRFITYVADDPKTKTDIWILPMTGERKPFLFLQTEFAEGRAKFSPDGRWIAYQSNESGRIEIYIRPFPGPGGKWQVSTGGGTYPHWSSDCRELSYLAMDKIMTAEIKLGASSIDVGSAKPLFQFRPFAGAGRDLYDVTRDGQQFLAVSVGGEESSSPITLVTNWDRELKVK
ncbi:MAG: serine/threonine protein kinase [Bacteroidetes bacterium]|nr:serine/threonine protein kinase [Bacteroidota bacterium]